MSLQTRRASLPDARLRLNALDEIEMRRTKSSGLHKPMDTDDEDDADSALSSGELSQSF